MSGCASSGSCGSCSSFVVDDEADIETEIEAEWFKHGLTGEDPLLPSFSQTPVDALLYKIDRVLELLTNHSDPTSMEYQQQIFSDVGLSLSHGNAQALKPLLSLFDSVGPLSFLQICRSLLQHQCVGLLLAWTDEHLNHNTDRLLTLFSPQTPTVIGDSSYSSGSGSSSGSSAGNGSSSDSSSALDDLIQSVNRQAAFFECFPGNPRVGRMSKPEINTTIQQLKDAQIS